MLDSLWPYDHSVTMSLNCYWYEEECCAVFQTATKDSSTISFAILKEICQSVRIPVVAIGGLNSSNVTPCLEAGCKGVAVVSAIFGAEDPRKAAQELWTKIDDFNSK